MAWEHYQEQVRGSLELDGIKQFTDDYYITHYAWTDAVDRDGALSEKEVLALFESDKREAEESNSRIGRARAAEFLLKRNVRPDLAMETLKEARQVQADEITRDRKRRESKTPTDIADSEAGLDIASRYIVGAMLTAARSVKRPELIEKTYELRSPRLRR